MSNPSNTARQQPTGYKMPDGYSTRIALANKPAINFWEKTAKASGVDTGDPIKQSTMLNNRWHTYAARSLVNVTPTTLTAAYDPDVISDILGQLGVNQSITVHFPDGSQWSFWGFVRNFEPQELKEGEQPEAQVELVPTNTDNSGVESGPLFTPAGGT